METKTQENKEKKVRLSWHEYFQLTAELVANRSTCTRRQVGCVIVSPDNRILCTGYNGAPSKVKHCLDTGCRREKYPSGERLDLCVATHAEANAIANAARLGCSINGATCYSNLRPCLDCLKLLINAGIKEVVYSGEYPLIDNNSLYDRLIEESGIILTPMKEIP